MDSAAFDFESAYLAVLSLETGEQRTLIQDAGTPSYASSGHLVFVRGSTLMAAPVDVEQLEVTGDAVALLEGIRRRLAADYALSANGTLVYVPGDAQGGAQRTLVWVDRQGNEEALPIEPGTYSYPRLSPDGTRVALDDWNAENDLWVWDLAQETRTRLTVGEGGHYPVWTADGGRIVYDDLAGNIYWKAANNTGVPAVVSTAPGTEGSEPPSPYFFSRDGTALVFRDQSNPDTRDNIGMIALEDGAEPVWLLDDSFNERNAELSPDGRWMAYQSDESGQWEIYVRPFPNVDDDRITVSNAGGLKPVWSRDGRELFYLEPAVPLPRLMSVAVEPGGPVFSVGLRTPILDWPYRATGEGRDYDVSPDGQRFLGIKVGGTDEGAQPQIIVVQNWLEELKRLVPVP